MKPATISLALLCAATQLVSYTTCKETDDIIVPFGRNVTASEGQVRLLIPEGILNVLVLFFDLHGNFFCEGIKYSKTLVMVDSHCHQLISTHIHNIRATIGVDIAEARGDSDDTYLLQDIIDAPDPCSQSFRTVRLLMSFNDNKKDLLFQAVLPLENCADLCHPQNLEVYNSHKPECRCPDGNHEQSLLTSNPVTVSEANICAQNSATSPANVPCLRTFSGIFHGDSDGLPFLLGIHVKDGSTCLLPQTIQFIDFTNADVMRTIRSMARFFGEEEHLEFLLG